MVSEMFVEEGEEEESDEEEELFVDMIQVSSDTNSEMPMMPK